MRGYAGVLSVFETDAKQFRQKLISAMRLDGYEPFKEPPKNYPREVDEFRLFYIGKSSCGGWINCHIEDARWTFHYALLLSKILKDKSVFATLHSSSGCVSLKIFRDGSCVLKAGKDDDLEIPYEPPPANSYNLKLLNDTLLVAEGMKTAIGEAADKMSSEEVMGAEKLKRILALGSRYDTLSLRGNPAYEEVWFIQKYSALYLNS